MVRILAAVGLLLLIPATALAGALPPAGLEAGGGGFGNHGKKGVGDRLLGLRVGADGRSVAFTGYYSAQCGGYHWGRQFDGHAAINDDGTFAADARTSRAGIDILAGHAKVHVAGTFDGALVSGAVSWTPDSRLGDGDGKPRPKPCITTPGAFQARDPGRPSGHTRTVTQGQILYGLSSNRRHGVRYGAIARVSPKPRRLGEVFVVGNVHCAGELHDLGNYSPPISVKPSGAFRIVEHFPLRYSNATSHYRVTTSGHFAASGGILGRLAASVMVSYENGGHRRCARAISTEYAVVP
jgi:hypothetical protein